LLGSAVRRHEISVFIFPERVLPSDREKRSRLVKEFSFNVETWSHAGLWYCVTGDVSAADIDNLAELLKGRRFIESLRTYARPELA
jgi:hypothetical protein